MIIPYIIDNQAHRMTDILEDLLDKHKGQSLDVAIAYFNADGFELLKRRLRRVETVCLLLGAERKSGEQVGRRTCRGRLACPEIAIPRAIQ